MTKFCSPCVVLLLLIVFSVDNVPVKIEAKTCTIAWQGCETKEKCDTQCLGRYGGHGYCFKPPIALFVECRCEYPC
ncbi:hypothetical protein C5167_017326 [Papaver somniferum]|uniref:Knottin scorpion toxin-like domain-containing protein n=1 Tax=Papaver somniferum TaxID=3469 RepID=A0A4Y7IMF1_PAPSO|nr:hypothetical protein C5167_017326 [Papaver somniferum]